MGRWAHHVHACSFLFRSSHSSETFRAPVHIHSPCRHSTAPVTTAQPLHPQYCHCSHCSVLRGEHPCWAIRIAHAFAYLLYLEAPRDTVHACAGEAAKATPSGQKPHSETSSAKKRKRPSHSEGVKSARTADSGATQHQHARSAADRVASSAYNVRPSFAPPYRHLRPTGRTCNPLLTWHALNTAVLKLL